MLRKLFLILLAMQVISGCSSFQSHEELKAPCTDDKLASLSIDCDKRMPVNVVGLFIQ
jgi:uncharacterized protein YceK